MNKALLTLLLGVASGSMAVSALNVDDTFTVDDITYKVLSDNTVSIDEVPYSTTSVNLTETVSYDDVDYTVVSVGQNAFYYTKVTNVVLPSTITSIEYGAFRSSSLASITLPEGLETIGDYAFSSTKLTEITIPEGVEALGASCFFTCNSLTNINLPSSLKTIGGACFYKVPMTSIALPEGLETIGKNAFYYCTKLTSVTLPSTLKTLTEGAFGECTALTSVNLPEGLETIGDEAFYKTGLTGSITLPGSITSLGGGVFAKTAISEINLGEGSIFKKVGDCIYNADKSVLIIYPSNCANTNVTVDSACRGIGYGAFWASNVTKVTLPEGMRAIDEYAFVQASSLSEINLPSSVVFIGEQAFAQTSLSEVTLPANLPELQDAAFAQCTALKTLNVPSSLTYMDIHAFSGCTSLQTVNCYGTTPATLEETYETEEGQFYNISSTAVLNLRPGCTAAYKSAGWNSYFKTVSESLPAIIEPTNIDPENDSEVSTFTGVSLTFDGTISVATQFPAIELREGPLTAGVPTGSAVSVTNWMAVVNSGEAPRIFPCDDDYGVESVKMEQDKDYYLTIPAGVFQNAAGELNERIFLHYVGNYTEPVFEPTSVNPATDSEVATFESMTLTFDSKPTLVGSTYLNTKIYKGSLVDGQVVGEEVGGYDMWWASVTGNDVFMFPGDEYDGFGMNVNFEQGADYYIVIPAKSFRNSSWVYNKEIILHYVGNYTEPVFEPTSVDPADGSTIGTFESMTLTFDSKPTLVSSTYQGTKIYKGAVENGEVVGDYEAWWGSVSGNNVFMFPGDEYDGFAMNVNFEAGVDYYIVIPAKSFRNSSWVYNKEITIHYVGAHQSAIETIEAANDSEAIYYNLQGVQVKNPANGIYIVKRGNNVTKEYISK
jgi:hypothetical protein